MKLIIHPGWWKTGTTAIQNQLASTYDENRERGIVYPVAGRFIDNAHHGFALSLDQKTGLDYALSFDEVADGILGESVGASTVVLSSELMPFVFERERSVEFVKSFSDVELVFTLRPQEKLIQSLFKQLVKDPEILLESSVFDVAGDNLDHLNFFTVVERWREGGDISIGSIKLLIHSDRIVEDFCGALGIPLPKDSVPRANESPSDLVTAVLHALVPKRASMDVAEREKFITFVISTMSGIRSQYQLLSSLEQSAVRSVFGPSNSKLAAKYLSRANLFNDDDQLSTESGDWREAVRVIADLVFSWYGRSKLGEGTDGR